MFVRDPSRISDLSCGKRAPARAGCYIDVNVSRRKEPRPPAAPKASAAASVPPVAPAAPLAEVIPLAAARRARARSPARDAGSTLERAAERSERSAIDSLQRALNAKTPEARTRHARAGLARSCDLETRGLLLRQLYLGELESGSFARARAVAEQLVSVGVLPDVAHHDAARACQAEGDFDAAVAHLREAARVAPKERRTVHLSALGGLLYAIGRGAEAIEPVQSALADGGSPAPLLRGQLALACGVADAATYLALANDPSGEGYGRFVLGELAFLLGDRASASKHLETFLARSKKARPAARAALKPEIDRAHATLGKVNWN